MMFEITVNANNVVLPDGNLYQATDTAYLTDEQYSRVNKSLFGTTLTLVRAVGNTDGAFPPA